MKRLYNKTPILTDFAPFTPTITNGGTTSNNQGFWRREGDSLYVTITTTFTSAGAAGSLLYSLPVGLTFDAYRVGAGGSRTIIGMGMFLHVGTQITQFVQVGGAGQGVVSLVQNSGTGLLQGNSLANTDVVSFYFCGPISGWSSSRRGR